MLINFHANTIGLKKIHFLLKYKTLIYWTNYFFINFF